jgi:glycine dehydrogenase subunit 1
MGPAGMRQAAQLCHNKTAYLAERLKAAGLGLRYEHPFFNELLVKLDRPVEEVLRDASRAGLLAGYAIGQDYPDLADCLLVAVTEKRTREEIDRLVDLLAGSAAAPRAESSHDADQFVNADLAE